MSLSAHGGFLLLPLNGLRFVYAWLEASNLYQQGDENEIDSYHCGHQRPFTVFHYYLAIDGWAALLTD